MPTMKVEQGELRINVEELINSLPEDDRTRIAKLIGADLHAWRQMAEAVASADNHYNGDEWWWFDAGSMLEVREKPIPLMPEIARIAAAEWQRQVDEAKKQQERLSLWAWAMYHAHNSLEGRPFPELPKWAPAVREEMRVRDAAPGMREALRAIEWQGAGPAGMRCPWCQGEKFFGHRAVEQADGTSKPCALAAALRAADGETP